MKITCSLKVLKNLLSVLNSNERIQNAHNRKDEKFLSKYRTGSSLFGKLRIKMKEYFLMQNVAIVPPEANDFWSVVTILTAINYDAGRSLLVCRKQVMSFCSTRHANIILYSFEINWFTLLYLYFSCITQFK